MIANENTPYAKLDELGFQSQKLIPGSKIYGKSGCTSLSRTSVWRGVRQGWFPSPVSVSPGRIAWFEQEVTTWLASRPRLRSARDGAREPLDAMS